MTQDVYNYFLVSRKPCPRSANRSFSINCAVKLNPIPRQSEDTRSFIFKYLPYVAFAVQNANNVEGVCLQSVINPNSLKSSDRP